MLEGREEHEHLDLLLSAEQGLPNRPSPAPKGGRRTTLGSRKEREGEALEELRRLTGHIASLEGRLQTLEEKPMPRRSPLAPS